LLLSKNITANDSFAISLYLPKKGFFIFSKFLPFSKYATHYDTFKPGKCLFVFNRKRRLLLYEVSPFGNLFYAEDEKNKFLELPNGEPDWVAMLSKYAQSFVRNKVQIFERYF